MIRLAVAAFLVGSFAALGADAPPPDDPAVVLATILSEKGTISVADLSRVQSADEHSRLAVLAGILREKGVLNSGDLARLSLPGVNAQPELMAETAPTGTRESSSPTQTASAEVTTKKSLPVSVYGTAADWRAGTDAGNREQAGVDEDLR
jgi:hypothetical protein